MPSAKTGIEGYLEWLARELADQRGRMLERFPAGLVVVQGSPAADPDSLAGSLAYAFLLHQERVRDGGSPPAALVAARLPIRREELALRPEVLALLSKAGIPTELLIDRDALDPAAWPANNLSVVLVDTDGRELPPGLRMRVVEMIDHHSSAGNLPSKAQRIVAGVGSACTLVAEQLLRRMPELIIPNLALLLLGPILLDTVDLDPAAGRVTERDRQAAARLLALAGSEPRGLYAELVEARTRLEGLSGGELLRRDYKQGKAGGLGYGLASLPLAAGEWLARAGEPGACLEELVEERGLDLLAVLFAFRAEDGTFRRQLLLRVRGAAMFRALKEYLATFLLGLQELSEPRLAARPADERGEWAGGLFDQADSGFSRKRLEPELRRFLESRKARANGR